VTEGEGVDAVVGFVFRGPIVEETSYESALEVVSWVWREGGNVKRTEPAY
jgi:hypothetical protein